MFTSTNQIAQSHNVPIMQLIQSTNQLWGLLVWLTNQIADSSKITNHVTYLFNHKAYSSNWPRGFFHQYHWRTYHRVYRRSGWPRPSRPWSCGWAYKECYGGASLCPHPSANRINNNNKDRSLHSTKLFNISLRRFIYMAIMLNYIDLGWPTKMLLSFMQ